MSFYGRYLTNGSLDQLITVEAANTFRKCGYYSVEPISNLRFLVLNTALYYHNNETLDETDPCGQIQWLREQLEQADEQKQVRARFRGWFMVRSRVR